MTWLPFRPLPSFALRIVFLQYALLYWILSVLLYGVNSTLVVVSSNASYPDRRAAFGSYISGDGVLGFMTPVDELEAGQKNACSPIPPYQRERWIALVERGDCAFIDKVRNMQRAGASAVVVGDNQVSLSLITMYAEEDTSDVFIPSVFISRNAYIELHSQAIRDGDIEIRLSNNQAGNWPLVDIVVIISLAPILLILFFYTLYRLRVRSMTRNPETGITSPSLSDAEFIETARKLPIKVYFFEKADENDPRTCAICLDDFEDAEDLRTLPCRHEFHQSCIDEWLQDLRKRFCPICKGDISGPSDGSCSFANAANNERTPLLSLFSNSTLYSSFRRSSDG